MDKIKEIVAQMEATLKAAQACVDAEEKGKLLDQFDRLKGEKELLEREAEAEKALVMKAVEEKELEEPPAPMDSVKAFARAARMGFKGMNEGTDADGGYIVPEDISTQIQHLREAEFSMRDLVTVKSVKTLSGARTYRTRSQQTGFSKVSEAGQIGAKGTPQFKRVNYLIEKYAGFYPVTNELLADTDANLVGELTDWIANEGRITDNNIIFAELDAKYTRATSPETEKDITGIDSIKNILNVDLGQAFKPTSVVVTNDSGLAWLDTLKDDNGRYLLSEDKAANSPMAYRLSAGATTVPLRVIPNDVLPDDDTDGTPFYIGDLKEAITLWDRKQLSVMSSNVAAIGTSDDAVNAFAQDMTVFRAIERLDCTCVDDKAYYKGFYSAS